MTLGRHSLWKKHLERGHVILNAVHAERLVPAMQVVLVP
jgi:hypothetical protein